MTGACASPCAFCSTPRASPCRLPTASPGGGRAWVHFVRSIQPAAAVIVLTAVDVESPAVEGLRDVAFEVLAKPLPADELLAALERATAGGREE